MPLSPSPSPVSLLLSLLPCGEAKGDEHTSLTERAKAGPTCSGADRIDYSKLYIEAIFGEGP